MGEPSLEFQKWRNSSKNLIEDNIEGSDKELTLNSPTKFNDDIGSPRI